MNYVPLVEDLVKPLVDFPEEISIEQSNFPKSKDVKLVIYANSKDLSKLIGREGMIANSIRQLVGTLAKLEHDKVVLRFESR